jgi:HSP20 family protein
MLYRRSSTPSLWSEMERLQQEMDRLFGNANPGHFEIGPTFPAMNIYTNEQAEIVTAEMPGFKPEDIEINVVGETLTISGERQDKNMESNAEYHRQERSYGKFTRSIELLFPVEADKVDAAFENGILRIHLPRAEADRPKKISVKTA